MGEFAVWLRKLKQGLCINLEGWGGEGDGREFQKGGDICTPMLIHVEVWQKTAPFCKAIILQLKKIRAKDKILLSNSQFLSKSEKSQDKLWTILHVAKWLQPLWSVLQPSLFPFLCLSSPPPYLNPC